MGERCSYCYGNGFVLVERVLRRKSKVEPERGRSYWRRVECPRCKGSKVMSHEGPQARLL